MAEPTWKSLVRELSDAGYESPYLDRLRRRLDIAQAQEELEKEIIREMAVALGRTEDKLLYALLQLELAERAVARADDPTTRAACVATFNARRDEALRARHELLIHREAVGIRRNAVLETIYPIPGPLQLAAPLRAVR